MQVTVNINLDESLLDGVHEKLDVIAEAQTSILYKLERLQQSQNVNQATDELELMEMSEISDRLDHEMASLENLTTVTDGIVAWAQTQTTALADVRAQLAARGVSDADLAQLDDVISATDAQAGRLAEVITTNTDAEDETPVNPVPTTEPTPPTSGDANDPSTAPNV